MNKNNKRDGYAFIAFVKREESNVVYKFKR